MNVVFFSTKFQVNFDRFRVFSFCLKGMEDDKGGVGFSGANKMAAGRHLGF